MRLDELLGSFWKSEMSEDVFRQWIINVQIGGDCKGQWGKLMENVKEPGGGDGKKPTYMGWLIQQGGRTFPS